MLGPVDQVARVLDVDGDCDEPWQSTWILGIRESWILGICAQALVAA
jgi:hypothetical protein